MKIFRAGACGNVLGDYRIVALDDDLLAEWGWIGAFSDSVSFGQSQKKVKQEFRCNEIYE